MTDTEFIEFLRINKARIALPSREIGHKYHRIKMENERFRDLDVTWIDLKSYTPNEIYDKSFCDKGKVEWFDERILKSESS